MLKCKNIGMLKCNVCIRYGFCRAIVLPTHRVKEARHKFQVLVVCLFTLHTFRDRLAANLSVLSALKAAQKTAAFSVKKKPIFEARLPSKLQAFQATED